MHRTLLSIVLAALSCSAFAGEDPRTAALDGVPGLDKPITLSLRAASIREVLDKVEAETGARLRPEREIAEDKASIWVKDRPARDVLRALAHCFNLCWTESEVGSSRFLRLYMDRKTQAELRQRHYDDYLAVLDQFDKQLQVTADMVRSGQTYEAPRSAVNIPRDELDRLWLRERVTRSNYLGAMVLQYLKLSELQQKDLFEGKVVTVSGGAIAEEAKDKYPEATSFSFWIERSLAGYLLQGSVQPVLQPWDWTLITTALFDDARYDKVIQSANEALAKDPALGKELPATKTDEKAPAAPTPESAPKATEIVSHLMYMPMSVTSAVPRPGEGSGATPATMSDGLLPIAEAAGIPVVAQYLSEYAGADAPKSPSTGVKAAQRLAELSQLHKFAVERDGDFLLAKSLLWHRLSDREVPEETIKRWQKTITGLRFPTFDVGVEMGSMSWGQVRGIINNSRYWFGASNLAMLAQCEYALKLYATLTPAQRQALSRGGEIPASTLKPEQQRIFIQAFEVWARPSYAKAQDPGWPRTAALSLTDSGWSGGMLLAVSGMRNVGLANLSFGQTEQYAVPPETPLTPEQRQELRERLQRQAEQEIPGLVRTFAEQVAKDHPEISQKSIEIYAERTVEFRLRLGEDDHTSPLAYASNVPW